MKRQGSTLAVLVLLWAPTVLADEFSGESFSLRLPAALSRFSSYGDVAGVGGASAGSKWSSSVNPAATGWLGVTSQYGVAFTPQYACLALSEGTRLHVASEAAVWDTRGYGAFQPAMAQVHSNTARTRQGLDFQFDMDYFQIQWGKRFADNFAFGANFNASTSEMRYDVGPFRLAKSSGESYDFRFGALYQPVERWLLGVVFDYGFSRSRTRQYDLFQQGWGHLDTDDTGHQFLLRPGVSYEYAKDSAVFVDYQLGHFRDSSGTLDVHRFFMGVDHRICKWLFVRGGVAIDTRGNPSWAAGLGIGPTDWLSIEVAYQGCMFPELKPDFGRSQLVVVSVGVQF